MHSITVSLHGSETAPSADVLSLDARSDHAGERFAILRFGLDMSVILPGRDIAAAAYLRQVATACLSAADQIALAALVEGPRQTSEPVTA